MRLAQLLLAASVILAGSVAPALAQPDRYQNGYYGNGQRHKQHKNWRKKHRKAIKRNWSDERRLYQSNWDRPNNSVRVRYDSQLRDQWQRYHHNNYNGTPTWSNYNDPQFIDYMHNNNPSLLNNLRSVLGF